MRSFLSAYVRPRLKPSARLVQLACVVCLAAGCANLPKPAEEAVAEPEPVAAVHEETQAADTESSEPAKTTGLPNLELTPEIIYELLLAEIAGQRGQENTAVAAYADLARSTRDPRIARRAVEVAIFARQNDVLPELAALWAELEPESLRARQTLVGALMGANRAEEAEPHVAWMLRQDPVHAGDLLLRLARSAASTSNRVALSPMLERLAATLPGLPEAAFVRAYAAQLVDNKELALTRIEEALKQRPAWDQAMLFHAQLLQTSGRHGEAMLALRAFIDRHPLAFDVRMQYAKALTAEKKFAEARQEFLALEKLRPNSAEALHAVAILSLQMGDADGAEARFKSLVELGQGDVNAFRLALGQLAESRKRLDEAMKWYDAIDTGERKLPARMRHAVLLSSQKGLDAALAYLNGVAAADAGERTQLLLGRAQLLRDGGREKEAFDLLEGGLKAHPDEPDLLYESALLAEKMGKKTLLETRLRRLIKIKPDNAQAYNALGYSLAERGERLDEAQALISKAVELAPGDAFILDSLGWVLYRKGDLEAAREKLALALSIRADPEIAAHLGEVLWQLGRHDEAEHTWKDAARDAPDNGALLSTMKKYLPAAP